MRFIYPARPHHTASHEIPISFRDLPESLTSGTTEAEALTEAEDVMEEAIVGRIGAAELIPHPSGRHAGEHRVAVPLAMAAKAALVLAFRDSGLHSGDTGC